MSFHSLRTVRDYWSPSSVKDEAIEHSQTWVQRQDYANVVKICHIIRLFFCR